jgi:hypothetical protein
MFSVTTQALLTIWPFLKRAIFRDRPILQVVLENRHITFMFLLLGLLFSTVVWVTRELEVVKVENVRLRSELEGVRTQIDSADIIARKKRLDELLK